jgi:hypothetical protein
MRLNRKSLWSALVVMFALMFAVPGEAFARPRSSSRSSSRPRASSPARSTSRSATPRRATKTGKVSNRRSAGQSSSVKSKKATKADQKSYDKAKANGTAFKTRKAASADFKKKNASKYTSTYASKPSTRPGHIPQTTMVGGKSTTIIYNQSGGGYGYMNALGTFMLYDAMSDMAMRPYYNQQMASAGYAYGPRPVVGMGGGTVFLLILAGAGFVGLVVVISKGV